MTIASLSFAFSPELSGHARQTAYPQRRTAGEGAQASHLGGRGASVADISISGLGPSWPFVSQRPEGERPSNGLSPNIFERMMSGAIVASWVAAMLGIGLFAYGVGFGWSVIAVAGLLCLAPALTGVALMVMISSRFRGPIATIAQAAARLSAGERAVRVDESAAPPELASLIDSFNRMAATLDSQEKQRLLVTAGITHELRTPLTILQGRLHAIEDGVIQPEVGETERLLRQVRHILHIVDDLDTLAKVESGRLVLTSGRVDLEKLFRPAVADLQALVARYGVRFTQEYQSLCIMGDPVRLTQILTNLLTNAVKHSPVGGEIAVGVRVVDGFAVVSVTDEGPGFAPGDKDLLFTPFWRSGASRRAGCPGSGMGLSLTAKLVQAHGGHIAGENRRDRSGACFSVSLPLA